MQANYPRAEVQKHLGRTADKYFQIQYEERKGYDFSNKLQLMEHQMRNETAYINRLSKLALGHKAVSEYKPQLSVEVNDDLKKSNIVKNINNKTASSKNIRYKNKKTHAFPGKNDNVLEDMVLINEAVPDEDKIKCEQPKKKRSK